MKRFLHIALMLMLCGLGYAQTIETHEYWIDNNMAGRTSVAGEGLELNQTIDVSGLSSGVHFFFHQAKNSDGKYGPVFCKVFLIPDIEDPNATLAKYEWWFDNGFENRETVSNSNTEQVLDLDISGLDIGLHTFLYRPIDSNGYAGNVFMRAFLLTPTGGDKDAPGTLAKYEYWIDNDYSNRVKGDNTNTDHVFDVDISMLGSGVHTFYYRAFDSNGNTCDLLRQTFIVPGGMGETNPILTKYECWIDNDFANRQSGENDNSDQSFDFDISGLGVGIHNFNYRALDNYGNWGPILVHPFLVTFAGGGDDEKDATLVSYEWWFDDNIDNRVSVNDSRTEQTFDLDISGLEVGMHTFNYRAINSYGTSSTVLTSPFLVTIEGGDEDAPLAKYEYWLDSDYAGRVTVDNTNTDLSFDVDISKVGTGVHVFNFRGINSNGKAGSLHSKVFLMPTDFAYSDVALAKYEWWIDNDYSNRKTVENSSADQMLDIDLTGVSHGLHTFHYVAYDNHGVRGKQYDHYFFVRLVSEDDDALGIQPLVGWTYTFADRSTFNPIPETYDYVMNNMPVIMPQLRNIAKVDEDCKFVRSLNANNEYNIKMSRDKDVLFSISFKDKADRSRLALGQNYSDNDEIEKAPLDINGESPVIVPWTEIGSFEALRINADHSGTYFVSFSKACDFRIYTATMGSINNVTYDEESGKYRFVLSSGINYIVVYNVDYETSNDDLEVTLYTNYLDKPTFTFADNGRITINKIQSVANIYYTLDGSTPTTESSMYTSPITVDRNCTVKAFASAEGWHDSDVTTEDYDLFKVAKPVIEYTNHQAVITTETPNATLYYSTDGGDPTTEYVSPINITENCTVRAIGKRDGYNDSDEAVRPIDTSTSQCITPVITREGNTLTMTTITTGAQIRYTTNGATPNAASTLYTGPITLTCNGTYVAIAMMTGERDSDPSEPFVVNDFTVAKPVLTFSDSYMTMTCSTPNSTIYYTTNGSNPTTSSTKYTSPVLLDGNYTVKAFAVATNFNNSEVAEYNITEFACEQPQIQYDGRYMTLSTTTNGATIYYTIDGATPSASSTKYSGPVDVNANGTIRAIAMKNAYDDSSVLTYSTPVYYDGEVAVVATAGSLNKAFGWCNINAIDDLTVQGNVNDADFATLRDMNNLMQLNIESVSLANKLIPDNALAGMELFYVSMPQDVETFGKDILASCDKLAAIKWNAAKNMPTDLVGGAKLPNLLVYARNKSYVGELFTNIIVNSRATQITLSDAEGSNFWCPEEFTADKISYTHKFELATPLGDGCAGWEAIALPFDVQTVTHEVNGEITPFKAGGTGKHFWLDKMSESLDEKDFVPADKIVANTPYIISMPNNENYADEYIMGGNVTFSSSNVKVMSSLNVNVTTRGEFEFVPNYSYTLAADNWMALNIEGEYHGYDTGSVFVANGRLLHPFEAYIRNTDIANGRRMYLIAGDEADSMNGIHDTSNFKIWQTDDVLYIETDHERHLKVYKLDGTLVTELHVLPGINKVQSLHTGIYVIGGVKLFVK